MSELKRYHFNTIQEYDQFDHELKVQFDADIHLGVDREELEKSHVELMRRRCRCDLFYLLTRVLNRPDANHPWILQRCIDIQKEPNECLDLWSREHYKSTVITFALTIQDILRTHGEGSTKEQWCFAIFSYVRPIAKDFLTLIKRELEMNRTLIEIFPDIFYEKPKVHSPRWSDEAIIVKRSINRRESTVEAWGVYEGQPVSRHFDVRIYDDMVTLDTVKTEERIKTTIQYWELSHALGSDVNISRYIGTRYAYNDPYQAMINRKAVQVRKHPATDDGTFQGEPVFWTQEFFNKKVQDMGKGTASAQLLQNPTADSSMGFKEEDLRYYDGNEKHRQELSRNHVRVILVDPSSGKQRKNNDYTSIGVYSLGEDNNYYLLDGVRDKIKLTGRASQLFRLHRKWEPKAVFYEEYGLQADVEHMQFKMGIDGYHFDIFPIGGNMPKQNRIQRLGPVYEGHRMYYPRTLKVQTSDGRIIDLAQVIKNEEYLLFPVPLHDDWLDMEARLEDPEFKKVIEFPSNRNRCGPKKLEYSEAYA